MNDQLMPLEVRSGLTAPVAYWGCDDDLRSRISNGCGPGGWKVDLVPDSIWGLGVRAACDIHDWCYYWGESSRDKEFADRLFLNNLLSIIDANSTWVMRIVRRHRAFKYYEAVATLGNPAFWSGKAEYAVRRSETTTEEPAPQAV